MPNKKDLKKSNDKIYLIVITVTVTLIISFEPLQKILGNTAVGCTYIIMIIFILIFTHFVGKNN